MTATTTPLSLLWRRSKKAGPADATPCCHFVSASGRRFERVNSPDDGTIFVFELIPNGRCVELDANGHVTRSWADSRLKAWLNDPNTLHHRIQEAGLADSLVLMGAAVDKHSILYHSAADADKAVMDALAGNYLLASRTGAPEPEHNHVGDLIGDQERELLDRVLYMEDCVRRMKESLDYAPGLLKGVVPPDASNLRHVHCCLLAFHNAPSTDTWGHLAQCMLFPDTTSALQLWAINDDDAPRMNPLGGVHRVHPDPDAFFAWLREESVYHLNRHQRLAEEARYDLLALQSSKFGMA